MPLLLCREDKHFSGFPGCSYPNVSEDNMSMEVKAPGSDLQMVALFYHARGTIKKLHCLSVSGWTGTKPNDNAYSLVVKFRC